MADRVLYMSGYPDEALQHNGGPGIEEHFIQKPFSADSLTAGIDGLFGK